MRKILITLALLCSSLAAYSPATNLTPIAQGTPINPYLKLWDAICQVESSNDPYAYNPTEEAYGIVQVRPIRLLDYYRRTGKLYSLTDCYNTEISKEIFLYYCIKYEPWDLETCAKAWNGSGLLTISYWHRVKSKLYFEAS